jgi:sensor histidine kinase YesM
MVENAIKHGICKTKSGGTVRIRSSETDAFYCISVSDDGAGFDVQKTIDDTKLHLGINNTRSRLHDMVGGSLDIESVPGKGTEVTIKIPKN